MTQNKTQVQEQSKKELVLAAFDQKPVERVPVGFWFHFLPVDEVVAADAFADPRLTAKVLAGQEEYIETSKPDYVKIMTDGFFSYQKARLAQIKTTADLAGLKPLAQDDPWFTRQIAYAKELSGKYGDRLALFYNLFVAATTLKWSLPQGDASLAALIKEDRAAVKKALDLISGDLARLAARLIKEGGVTGIYLSLQNIQGLSKADYEAVIAPGEKVILAAANQASPYNILHICGYEGHRNDLSWYRDYQVKAVNWAVAVEGIPLEEGQKIFKGRAVIGGFGNTAKDVLYSGTREEVEQETKRILVQAGRTGVILGADCTVPPDIDRRRFDWVRDAAK